MARFFTRENSFLFLSSFFFFFFFLDLHRFLTERENKRNTGRNCGRQLKNRCDNLGYFRLVRAWPRYLISRY